MVVAKSIGADYVDLNRESVNYLNAIGEANVAVYNLIPTDFTHLNAAGSVLFGNMVSLLLNKRHDAWKYKEWTKPNSTIATDIEHGTFILPTV
jgi:hypothetical protein